MCRPLSSAIRLSSISITDTGLMYQPVALFIGLRYLCGGASDRFGRFISWLSAIGIMLGVMALIIVLSVMNGFENELEKNTLALMPQALITSQQGFIDPAAYPASELKLTGVSKITSLTTGDVMLQSAHNVGAGVMIGINPGDAEPLLSKLLNTKPDVLQPGSYNLIIGQQLASQLGVRRGDRVRLMVPSVSQFTPMGRIPSQRLFTIAGTFVADSDVSSYQILVNQQDASKLMHYPPGDITGWRLWLDKPLRVDTLSHQPLPAGMVWQDWRERKGELFAAVRMEKNMMGLLLSLIVAVAAFNIITSLGLLIMEKQAEVAILLTQGLTRRQVVILFMIQGATMGIAGSLFGALLGLVLASQINTLIPTIGVFLEGQALPVVISIPQVVTIVVVAMMVALLSTLYPALRAATVKPAEALRYE